MYNFKSVVQIQKPEWEDVIEKRVSIGGPKARNNLAIKRF